jgi:serine-type D-Ala-D-Ala carboxypeptidase (penicillin-binding protein 5/6)
MNSIALLFLSSARRCALALAILGCAAAAAAAPSALGLVGAKAGGEFQTTAPYAILLDADTGSILFEKNADAPTAPSSMTKLMTAEVVFNEIKQNRVKLENEYIVSEDAWRRGGAPSRTSSMFAPIHSRVRVEDLIRGALIVSGNDACIALAEGIAGSEPAFAEMMNKRAKELGLTRSYFTNSTGLPDPAQKVTVRDLAKLARQLIRTYPNFYKIFGERDFTWNKIRQQNRNPLLEMATLGADGLKTGYTLEGGYGLVGSAVQGGLRLIVVVNGLKSIKERSDEARKLLEYGYHGVESKPLFAEGQIVGYAKLFGGTSGSVALVGDGPISVLLPKNSSEKVTAKIVYSGPVPAPVERGQPIGNVHVYRGEQVIAEMPLFAAASVDRGSLPRRAFDAASELVIGLFRSMPSKI